MEYVHGETLKRWRIVGHRRWTEILAVYERAGSGLAAAHEAGLVHRDFKPDNVLIGHDGRVRVTDFGLARSVDDDDSPPSPRDPTRVPGNEEHMMHRTRTGAFVGTPAYMSPEQLRGEIADARSDIFSFCVALYEALYGERPFEATTVSELLAAVEAKRVRPAPILTRTRTPSWVREILLRGLCASPEARFPSMRALLDAFRTAHSSSQRRARFVRLAVGALVLILAVGALVRMASAEARCATPNGFHSPRTAGWSPRSPIRLDDRVVLLASEQIQHTYVQLAL
jgi:serine/threonine protein kinase